jgi:hypothetical protein
MSGNVEPNGVEPAKSEDDLQREKLGPRGVPGGRDPAKMTPQRDKKTPKIIDPGIRPDPRLSAASSFPSGGVAGQPSAVL